MDWRSEAACRRADPELFFPIGATGRALQQTEQAKAMCASCPVCEPCLTWVLEAEPLGQESGVCAGLAEDERRALKRRVARAAKQPVEPAGAAYCQQPARVAPMRRR